MDLPFISKKAIGQGVDPLEIFEHFDTDFSGEIDVPEFVDGLKRLGIYLTNAENLALLQRFSIQV
jgi:Ca2+-binding EF-hand superfamily protein